LPGPARRRGHGRLAEANEQRAAERLAVDHLEAVAGGDPAVGQVAQHLGVGVRDAHERPPRAGWQRLEALGARLVDGQVAGGDRIAVGVVCGIPELGGDQLLQLVGEDMLEHFGLLVHAVPRHPEALHQVELEQPVMADHLEGDPPAGAGQRDPAITHVGDQPQLAQALDHPRGRGGRDAHPLGQRRGAHRLREALLQSVDRLAVVLDCG